MCAHVVGGGGRGGGVDDVSLMRRRACCSLAAKLLRAPPSTPLPTFQVDYNVSGDFNGRRMQEQLFERLWEDTTLRIRNAGVSRQLGRGGRGAGAGRAG